MLLGGLRFFPAMLLADTAELVVGLGRVIGAVRLARVRHESASLGRKVYFRDARYLAQSSQPCANVSGRPVLFAHLVERPFDALERMGHDFRVPQLNPVHFRVTETFPARHGPIRADIDARPEVSEANPSQLTGPSLR